MNRKNILYIGNNLTKSTKYSTTMDTLSNLLSLENYKIIKSSNKSNKFIRMFDMCLTIIKNCFNVDYILIDTFSTSNFYYAFITSQLARVFKIKYIPILHGGNLPYRLDKSKNFSNLIFKNSYRNIAPSNYLKYEFEKRNYDVKFIPNILEIQNYEIKKKTSIKPKLLWVRAFKQLYNPQMAIEVLSILKENFSKAKLCMVGPFTDHSYNETIELVKKHGLENCVEFTGVLSKEKWIKKSNEFDIFINTTNFDNTPVSVMEAMALGLTIVSTNAGGMPYLINDGYDGILVNKNDSQKMANEIINLINNNNQQLALNARKKVENFDWTVVRNQWNSILK